jgi:hypothetical protein
MAEIRTHDTLIMCSTLYLLRHQWFVVNPLHYGIYTMYVRGQVAPSMLSSLCYNFTD